MRYPKITKQQGFAMLELSFAVALGTVLLVAQVNYTIKKRLQEAADLAAIQIFNYGELVQSYRSQEGQWPLQATGCTDVAGVFNELVARGYLAAAPSGNVAFGNPVQMSCNALTFTISSDAVFPEYAQQIGSRLPVSRLAGTVVSAEFPALTQPLLTNVLHRVAVPGRPELNRMTTDIDMGGNGITNARGLEWGAPNGNRSFLTNDGGGSIELNSYLDFKADTNRDYTTRLVSSATNDLLVQAENIQFGSIDTVNGFDWAGRIISRGSMELCTRGDTNCGLKLSDDGGLYDLNDGWLTFNFNNIGTDGVKIGSGAVVSNGVFTGGDLSVQGTVAGQAGVYTRAVNVGTQGSQFTVDTGNGGATVIELGAGNFSASNGRPYMDFHYLALTEDYNVRIVNDANRRLTVDAAILRATEDLSVGGDAIVAGDAEMQDGYVRGTDRNLSQAITIAGVYGSGSIVPYPTCPPTTVPRIFTAVKRAYESDTVSPIYGLDTTATPGSDGWLVNTVIQTASAQTVALGGSSQIMVLVKCE